MMKAVKAVPASYKQSMARQSDYSMRNNRFFMDEWSSNNNKKFAKLNFLMKISYHKPKNPFSSFDLLYSVVNSHADGLSIFIANRID